MKDEFLAKCKEVFEKTEITDISEETFLSLRKIYGFDITAEHKHILSHYAGIFLRENYEICSKYHSPMADEAGAEPFMFFLGTKGRDNLFSTYITYKEQLSEDIFPIAIADGGNLLCCDKEGFIYLWIHDSLDKNVYKIFDSLTELILSIRKVEYEKNVLGVIETEVKLADDFWAGLE